VEYEEHLSDLSDALLESLALKPVKTDHPEVFFVALPLP
jgi:hypothetical protein